MDSHSGYRREFNRYQPNTWGNLGSVSDGKYRYRAEILDESLAGVGLRLASRMGFQCGQVVKVDNGQFSRKAKLVYVADDPSGGIRAGVQWTPDSSFEPV